MLVLGGDGWDFQMGLSFEDKESNRACTFSSSSLLSFNEAAAGFFLPLGSSPACTESVVTSNSLSQSLKP